MLATAVGQGTTPSSAQISPAEQQIAELRQQLSGAQIAAQRAQVIAVVYQLDTAGFHALDEAVSAGRIPAGSLGQVRRGRIALQATTWPEGLRDTANRMASAMAQLEPALRDEDANRAKGPASDVHELGHDLSDQAYTWLGSGSPAAAPATTAPALDDHNHATDDHAMDEHNHATDDHAMDEHNNATDDHPMDDRDHDSPDHH
jgi:hypothetical protein